MEKVGASVESYDNVTSPFNIPVAGSYYNI